MRTTLEKNLQKTNNIIFRKIASGDEIRGKEFIKDLVKENTPLGLNSENAKTFFQGLYFAQEKHPENVNVQIILHNNKIIGFVNVIREHELVGKVGIAIAKEHRRKGIGTAALQRIEIIARQMGFKGLIAKISAANTASVKLFSKNGYRELCEIPEAKRYKGKIYGEKIYYKKI